MAVDGFHAVDYVLFVATLGISLTIGVFYSCTGGKQRTTHEYFLGNRALKTIPVTVSIFMSYISAVLLLGNTAEMYQYGIQYWLAWTGSSLAFILSAVVFVPFFHELRMTSSFAYLEKRFNSKLVRIWACMMFLLSSIVYMGLAMFTPATALEAATGFPLWASIVASGVVGTVYTSLGGMKAVVWTDVFQGLVMVAGVLAILIVGTSEVGGLTKIWETCKADGRTELFNFDPDPTVRLSFWSIILGRFFLGLGVIGTGQPSIQRYSSLASAKNAQMSALLNVPAIAVMYTLTCLCGLTVYAYYSLKSCDPLQNNEISSPNQLLPYFVMEVVNHPGIPGTFLAVLFSGALSSISSSLNSNAACAWEDLLLWKFHHLTDVQKAVINKFLVLMFGGLAICMAFMASYLDGNILQASNSLLGAISGPSLGIFTLGTLFPRTNWQGAFFGSLTGFAFVGWISLGAYVQRPFSPVLQTSTEDCAVLLPNVTTTQHFRTNADQDPNADILPLYLVSYMYNSVIGTCTTIITGQIISLLTGPTDPKTLESNLTIPIFDKLCCCLPTHWGCKTPEKISPLPEEDHNKANSPEEPNSLHEENSTEKFDQSSPYLTFVNDLHENTPL